MTMSKSSYARVNGLNMYYEIHGEGQPLVLLHGALSAISTSFGKVLPQLSSTRQVIAVELQAHGHTADIDRPLTYEQMADDTAALINHLGLERADVFGVSVGGGVALQTAIRHPEVVRKLVVASGSFSSDGEYPEIHAMEASFHPDAPFLSHLREVYVSVAPRQEDWSHLVTKMRQLLVSHYDWTQDVAAIQAPTLIIIGDADTVRLAHVVELFEL